jgi:agmatinase
MTFIVKVPGVNGLGHTEGCEKAGNAIIKELRNIHSSEQGKSIEVSLLDLEEIHLNNSDVEEANKLIYENSLETFQSKPKTIFIGGDHSVSYSIVKAFLDNCNEKREEPCLIVFDSHADCMEPMQEPTHEEWLRAVIEKGFPAENVLLVGARNIWKTELEFLSENKIKRLSINQFVEDMENACDTIMEFANGRELYVSIDIDVIDPLYAPATGYPEPGGLTSRQFLYLIQRINKIKTLRAVDIVEINPEKDKEHNNKTVKLGAKILAEII